MFKTEFENLRRTCPLIHNITNYVTVNDCANMVSLPRQALDLCIDGKELLHPLHQSVHSIDRYSNIARSFYR